MNEYPLKLGKRVIMTYEQIFPDLESLRIHVGSLNAQRTSLYSDFSKAVFGYIVHDESPEFEALHLARQKDPTSRATSQLPIDGKIYVWEKFGKELTSETILVSSIGELLSYEEANKAGELYRFSDKDNVSIIDYSKAAEGKSIIISLTPEAFASKDFREAINFPARSWFVTLGIIKEPEKSPRSLLNQTPSPVSNAVRPIPNGSVPKIRPRLVFPSGSK
jgi:hypothetical protein